MRLFRPSCVVCSVDVFVGRLLSGRVVFVFLEGLVLLSYTHDRSERYARSLFARQYVLRNAQHPHQALRRQEGHSKAREMEHPNLTFYRIKNGSNSE